MTVWEVGEDKRVKVQLYKSREWLLCPCYGVYGEKGMQEILRIVNMEL
jgi:hypothetical protein